MRTVIGWMAAMFASALLGAAVYQTVLSEPLPELDPTATVQEISRDPDPGPTMYRTEVRTVVDPTPTVTVEDVVLIEDQAVPATQTRTSSPAPAITSAPRLQSTDDRDDERDDESDDDAEDREDADDDEDSEDREDGPDDDEDSEDD